MFPLQQAIQTSLPELHTLWKRYTLPENQYNKLAEDNQTFTVRVPLIGAFSAGKSSLINALLGEKLLKVDIDPASSLATELHYDQSERIIGHTSYIADKDTQRPLTRQQLQDQDFEALQPDGWVEVYLSADILARYPHLCLADLPGLDSALQSHSNAINNYIGRSLAYCLVISSDEGTLHQTTRDFLKELALHKAPVLVIISKSDKKPEADIAAIATQLHHQVLEILGDDAMLEIVSASGRKKLTQDFEKALDNIEARSEQRFRDVVGNFGLQCLAELEQRLTILLNQDDLDHEKLLIEQQELKQEMTQYQENLKRETVQVKGQLEQVLSSIVNLIEGRLKGQLEQLAHEVASQRDLNSTISQTVRIAMTEGVQQELAPVVQSYIDRVESDLPEAIKVNHAFQFTPTGSQSDHSELISTGVSLVTFALKRFPVVAVLMPIITTLIGHFASKYQQEQKIEEQREQARAHVLHTVIPSVMVQVRDNVRQVLNDNIKQVEQKLAQQAQERFQIYQESLNQLEQQLQQGAEKRAQAQQGFTRDLQQVQQLSTTWKSL